MTVASEYANNKICLATVVNPPICRVRNNCNGVTFSKCILVIWFTMNQILGRSYCINFYIFALMHCQTMCYKTFGNLICRLCWPPKSFFPFFHSSWMFPSLSIYFLANGYPIMVTIMLWVFTTWGEWFCLAIAVPEYNHASKDVIYSTHNDKLSTSYLSVKWIVQNPNVKIIDFDQNDLGTLWRLGLQHWPHTFTVKQNSFRCLSLEKYQEDNFLAHYILFRDCFILPPTQKEYLTMFWMKTGVCFISFLFYLWITRKRYLYNYSYLLGFEFRLIKTY